RHNPAHTQNLHLTHTHGTDPTHTQNLHLTHTHGTDPTHTQNLHLTHTHGTDPTHMQNLHLPPTHGTAPTQSSVSPTVILGGRPAPPTAPPAPPGRSSSFCSILFSIKRPITTEVILDSLSRS